MDRIDFEGMSPEEKIAYNEGYGEGYKDGYRNRRPTLDKTDNGIEINIGGEIEIDVIFVLKLVIIALAAALTSIILGHYL